MSEPAPEGQRELEALLRRVVHEVPAARVRSRVLRSFLLGVELPLGQGAERGVPGSRSGEEGRMDTRLEPALETWLARTDLAPPARRAFREELAEAFRSGRFSRPAEGVQGPPARPVPRLVRFAVLAAAAAAIVAVTFLVPGPPRWQVRLEGPVRLSGVEYRPGDEGRLAVELEFPGQLEALSTPVVLELERGFELELLPGGKLGLPGLVELDGATPIEMALAGGEAYLRTARGAARNPIRLRTPQAAVELSGTVLGLLADPEEACTCVCVAEGSVTVESEVLPEGPRTVDAGRSFRVFAGGASGPDVPFPEDPADPGYGHAQGLLRFARGE